MEIIDVKKEMEKEVQVYVSTLPVKITNNESYLAFTQELLSIKDRLRTIDNRLEPEKKKARAAWQSWIDLIDELKAPLLEKETAYKKEIATWSAEQEKIRQAEERRLQEIARKEEIDRKLAEAIAAPVEEQAAILDEPVYVAPVIVPKAVPKVQGVSMSKRWTFKIDDETKIPREYLSVDLIKIGAVVRALKDQAKIPGIRIYAEDVVMAGRRAVA